MKDFSQSLFYDVLLTEEEKRIRDEVESFVKNEVPSELIRKMDKEEVVFPGDFIKAAAEKRLLGLRFPSEYGGRNATWVAEVAAIEQVGVLGFTLSCQYSMPSIVGEALNLFGTSEQKRKYLEPMLKGELYSAEAITDPSGGSDVFGAMKLVAKKEGNHYVLNGEKRFVVGGEGADFFIVYAKTNPKAVPPQTGVSTFIVERDFGVKVATVYGLLGTRGGGTARIVFKDVKVPEENLLGKENGGYDVFNRMMVPERMTSAAGAIGTAIGALEVAVKYSSLRKAFGRKIKDFQGVSFKVSDSIMKIDAARGLVYTTARMADEGVNLGRLRRVVAESKAFATEAAWETVNHAMQILGGIGYTTVYPIERLFRDLRLSLIWTGTNEIMRAIIQHEIYKEILNPEYLERRRNIELDTVGFHLEEEKVYE